MAFVADARGVEVVRIDELGREISPLRDLMATIRLARLIRKERPQILHTHTAKAGAVGRVAARLAGLAEPADRRPHVPRPRPPRLLRAGPHARLPAARALARRRHDGAHRSQPAGSRRPRRARRRPARALRRHPARHRARRARRAGQRTAAARAARYLGIPGDRVRRRLDRPHDGGEARPDDVLIAFKRLRDSGVDAVLCMVGDGPDRVAARAARARARRRPRHASSSATRKTSRPSTRPSTRWCCRRGTRERP